MWWNMSQQYPGRTKAILPFYSAWREHTSGVVSKFGVPRAREIDVVKKAQRRATKVQKMITALRIQVETDYLALRRKTLRGDNIIHVYPIYDGRE